MKKFIFILIACFSVLMTGCDPGSNTGIGENSETGAETAEIAAYVQESAASGTETEVEKAVSAISVDYMQETLRADWNDGTRVVSLYATDLNGDGIDELFVSCLFGTGARGLTYVYDVSVESRLLGDMGLRMYFSGGGLYRDEEDKVHFVSMEHYTGALWEEDRVYYDVNYGDDAEIKIPFCAEMYDWYDGGLHMFEYKVYTDCGYFSPAINVRNFDTSRGNFLGIYDSSNVAGAGIEVYSDTSKVSDEIKEIIEQSVFEGLTYVSDVEMFYQQEGRTEEGKLKDLTFDEFWESASPVLAEYYADQL